MAKEGTIRLSIDVGDGGDVFVFSWPFRWNGIVSEGFPSTLRAIPDHVLASLADWQLRDYAEKFEAKEAVSG